MRRLDVLGPPGISSEEGFAAIEDGSVFAYLVLASVVDSTQRVATKTLIERMWPDGDRLSDARNLVSTYVSEANRHLGDESNGAIRNLRVDGGGYRLDRPGASSAKVKATIDTDIDVFRHEAQRNDDEGCRAALALVRGEFMSVIDSDRSSWLVQRRAYYRQEFIKTVKRLADWPDDQVHEVVDNFLQQPVGTLLDAVDHELASARAMPAIGREPAKTTEPPPEAQTLSAPRARRMPWRIALRALPASIAVAIGIGAVFVVGTLLEPPSRSNSPAATSPLPAPGTLVNSNTGTRASRPAVEEAARVDFTGPLADEYRRTTVETAMLGVCDETTESPCSHRNSHQRHKVNVGDTIKFTVFLAITGHTSLPLAWLTILDTGHSELSGNELSLAALVRWFKRDWNRHSGSPPSLWKQTIVFPGSWREIALVYTPGSTRLYDQSNRLLARLPDGITDAGTGVYLGELGRPHNCEPCSVTTIRFLTFKARVRPVPEHLRSSFTGAILWRDDSTKDGRRANGTHRLGGPL